MPGGPRVDSDDGEGDWSSEPSDDERLEVLSNSSSEAEDDSAAQQGRAARSNLATTKKDLLYDAKADDEDARWLSAKLESHKINEGSEPPGKWTSDATLSCPLCFTPVCHDCQRHDTYKNQYRAVFVENCTVLYDQILSEAPSASKQQTDKNGSTIADTCDSTNLEKEEYWHPVQCEACSLEIAVLDQDEVYHFFNVFSI